MHIQHKEPPVVVYQKGITGEHCFRRGFFLFQLTNEDLLLVPEVAALVDMATKLANSVSDAALDEAREAWGNTNVAVVKHWREQTRAALAPFQETDDAEA